MATRPNVSGFQVFYMKAGEVYTYLRDPVAYSEAEKQASNFEDRYYNKQYPNGRGKYNVSRPWVGRV